MGEVVSLHSTLRTTIRFRDHDYSLRVEFNHEGQINRVNMRCDEMSYLNDMAQDASRICNDRIALGWPVNNMRLEVFTGDEMHPVRGFDGVERAGNVHHVLFQVLELATPPRKPVFV